MKITYLMQSERKKFFSCIQIVFALFLFVSLANAQNQKVQLSGANLTLKAAFKQIEQQTEMSVDYDAEVINTSRQVPTVTKTLTVNELLKQLLRNTGYTYTFEGTHILIKVQQFEGMKKKVTGTISDETGLSVIGANVVEKGTTNGVITDLNGNFTIEVADNAILKVSYVGYSTSEMRVGNRTHLAIQIKEDAELLDEVVVIGYGVVKKSDLTGSVSSVKSEEVNAYPSANLLQAISGKTSGMEIKQNTGAPGGSISVRIRGANSVQGSNEPLYVVDGFPISGSPTNLNNSDIESIEILKDASATAIYGSRGANGVVMITTKQGKTGKTRVELDASYTTQSLVKKLDLMNATEYAQFYNMQQLNDTGNEYFTADQIAGFGEGYDWQDLIFRNAPILRTNLSITGGNEKTQFMLGGSVYMQDGIIKGSDYDRYSLQAKINHKVNKYFAVNFSSSLTRAETDRKDSGGGARGSSMISSAISAPPTLTPYNEDGSYRVLATEYPFVATDIINPVNFINEQSNHVRKNSVLANVSFIITPISDLTIKIMGGIQNNDELTSGYKSLQFLHSSGNASLKAAQFTSLLSENTVNYSKRIGKHSFSVLGGFTYQNFLDTNVSGSGTGFLNDVFDVYSLQSASTPGIPSSFYAKSVLLSYLARVNYSFNDKYLLTASIRRDGSSRFSDGNKWGNFPSAAFAWRVSNEDFLKDVKALSNLKVRASWGKTGSQAIAAYATLNTLSNGKVIFDDALYNTFAPGTRLPGDLKWETTEQYDFGVDIGLWNRLNITLDGYLKNTSDLLNTVILPSSSGYTSTIRNVGKVQNKGFEASVDARILTGEVKWNVNANISFNRNKVKKLNGGEDIYGGSVNAVVISDETNILREGYPIGQFYGYLENGYDSEGRIVFKDLDGDNVITKNDKTFIGDPNPDFIYGFTTDVGYKGFELSLFFQGSQGNDLFNASAISNTIDYGFGLNMPKEVFYNHWTPENVNAKYPAISYNTTVKVSDRFIENGSFLRLRNIQLTYNLPVKKLHWKWINDIQVYASGQNLLTFTKYSWWDPEVNSFGGSSSTSQGIDFNSYPSSKSYTFGVRFGF